jgi:hypothetical protein
MLDTRRPTPHKRECANVSSLGQTDGLPDTDSAGEVILDPQPSPANFLPSACRNRPRTRSLPRAWPPVVFDSDNFAVFELRGRRRQTRTGRRREPIGGHHLRRPVRMSTIGELPSTVAGATKQPTAVRCFSGRDAISPTPKATVGSPSGGSPSTRTRPLHVGEQASRPSDTRPPRPGSEPSPPQPSRARQAVSVRQAASLPNGHGGVRRSGIG